MKPASPELSLAEAFADLAETVLAPETLLVKQGDASEFAYFLKSGAVTVFVENRYGTVTLATREAPQLIGEIGVLSGLPRTASIKAAGPITVAKITAPQLLDVAMHNPHLLLTVIGQLGQQIGAVNKAVGFYTTALSALEQREFDPAFLEELSRPPPQLAEFTSAFKRFAQQITAKRRQEDELAGAAIIQKSFLPKKSALKPLGARVDLHAAMRPARDVGGDFFDYFIVDDNRLGFCIGDICGKGISASIFMSVVITTLRTAAREEADAAAMLARTNAILARDNAACMFATVLFGILEIDSGVVEYCNCGHNPPYVIDSKGALSNLPATGLPLGLYGDRAPGSARITLQPSETLLLFTDGVTEAMNPHNEEFGDERLAATIGGKKEWQPAQLVADIFLAVDEFAGGAEQADDITLLALRRPPASSG